MSQEPTTPGNVTSQLKAELWRRYGDPAHPAEWDGLIYGGGRPSQRFWEYFRSVELLDLTQDDVVLDIGGGSPTHGAGFFASLLATRVKRVVILDANASKSVTVPSNVTLITANADFKSLEDVFRVHPEITAVSCVSVFEHIPADIRKSITTGLEQLFRGNRIVLTLEYHPNTCFVEHQLTMRTLSEALAPFKNFYLDAMDSCPTAAENSRSERMLITKQPGNRNPLTTFKTSTCDYPRWYPLALRLLRTS